MIWMVKLLHLTTVSIWAGGLVALPFLLLQRRRLTGEPLHRLHRMARMVYVSILSPAAFLAIGSGTALVFLRDTFVEWFSVKLVIVGVLTALHVRAGLLILKVFDADASFSRGGATTLTVATLLSVTGVLLVVLWKPSFDAAVLNPDLFRPGGLSEALAPAIVWATP
ncbi:CopD family protein [Roseicyclus mahoneyensis]|jgi:protoporphyrinogen IX oxidase|uniref:Putative membrane protein n=1 Tax=Roseicyclus mahoneyensis TaxID=164332 RepID=A0A316GPM6_9RHOB|nr:CopD family protein [Roseicyclus mahoneyensis]PWK61454.1 putative membrane protein [Roseicyclus mahoneyensis]